MKRLLSVTIALSAFAGIALAGPWFVPGDYYDCGAGTWCFDANNEMFDDGLHGDGAAADGVFGVFVPSNQAAGRHEFKFAYGDWSTSYHPNCNLWVYIENANDVIHFTFDTNLYADGWVPTTNVYWSDKMFPAGSQFEVIGSAPETGSWGSGVAGVETGGVFEVTINIATAGVYEYKWRGVGSWDVQNFGGEGAVPCGFNGSYETTFENQDVLFQLDTNTGRIRALPLEPTSTTESNWGSVKELFR